MVEQYHKDHSLSMVNPLVLFGATGANLRGLAEVYFRELRSTVNASKSPAQQLAREQAQSAALQADIAPAFEKLKEDLWNIFQMTAHKGVVDERIQAMKAGVDALELAKREERTAKRKVYNVRQTAAMKRQMVANVRNNFRALVAGYEEALPAIEEGQDRDDDDDPADEARRVLRRTTFGQPEVEVEDDDEDL